MRLASIRVEWYSGIQSASLHLEPDVTAVVGENDSGKLRLLEALDAVLGGDPDEGPPTFASPAARVELVLEEREPGEWSDGAFEPLHASLAAEDGLRRLTLEAADGSWALLGAAGSRRTEPELFAWLRRMSPVIALGRHTWEKGPGRLPEAPAEVRGAVETVLRSAYELLDGTATDPEAEVERGFAAAAEVIARSTRHLDPNRPVLHPVVAEVMGQVIEGVGPLPPRWLGSGTSAERMGILLVVASLLREIGRPFAAGAQPILVVESLEARLHVMTLAAAMRLLARLRWQRILTTESTDLLGVVPLRNVRRLVRHDQLVYESRIGPGTLSQTDLRRITYHLRERRGQAMFARCWLLIEGESEAWLLPELARILGYELVQEGIVVVEFAQSGLAPAIRTAAGLGIEWHVLTDGDEAGEIYRGVALEHAGGDPPAERVTALEEPDLEQFLWRHGFGDVYRRVGNVGPWGATMPRKRVIRRAIENVGKPMLALEVLGVIAEGGPEAVPEPLRSLVETCVKLARESPARLAARRGDG